MWTISCFAIFNKHDKLKIDLQVTISNHDMVWLLVFNIESLHQGFYNKK